MLGILLSSGLCGLAGKRRELEGKTATGLAVAFNKYRGFVGDLDVDAHTWMLRCATCTIRRFLDSLVPRFSCPHAIISILLQSVFETE